MGNGTGYVYSGLLPKHLNNNLIYSYKITPMISRAGHFNFFFENLSWVVWNWMGMIKDSICQKFEVLNH